MDDDAMSGFRARCARTTRYAFVVGLSSLVGLTGCVGGGTGEPHASTPSATPAVGPGVTGSPLPSSDEPVAIEPGTYRIPRSAWSVADFTVTFPKGWTVQYGHVYAKHPDADDELGFYAVTVDEIYADACAGSNGELIEVGPSVLDLAAALFTQVGPRAEGPFGAETSTEVILGTLGGYPAIEIDLYSLKGFDLTGCNAADIGLQIWYSPPADKNFVLLRDGIAWVYILDVDGQRQVFLAQHRSPVSGKDMQELQAVLDSIRIEP
jgi:hypothetical protein